MVIGNIKRSGLLKGVIIPVAAAGVSAVAMAETPLAQTELDTVVAGSGSTATSTSFANADGGAAFTDTNTNTFTAGMRASGSARGTGVGSRASYAIASVGVFSGDAGAFGTSEGAAGPNGGLTGVRAFGRSSPRVVTSRASTRSRGANPYADAVTGGTSFGHGSTISVTLNVRTNTSASATSQFYSRRG